MKKNEFSGLSNTYATELCFYGGRYQSCHNAISSYGQDQISELNLFKQKLIGTIYKIEMNIELGNYKLTL